MSLVEDNVHINSIPAFSEPQHMSRIVNGLEDVGIATICDLLYTSKGDLLEIPNFGEKTLNSIYAALRTEGFYVPGTEPPMSSKSTAREEAASRRDTDAFGEDVLHKRRNSECSLLQPDD